MNLKTNPFMQSLLSAKRQGVDLKQKINNLLIIEVYNHGIAGLIASLFCSIIIFIGIYTVSNPTLLFLWFGAVLIVTLLRFILIKSFLNRSLPEQNYKYWARLYTIGALLGGLCWGLVGSALFPYPHTAQLVFCILIIAGVSAGAVPVLSGIVEAAIVFLLAALVPLFVRILFTGDYAFLLYDATIAVYLLYLIVLSIKTYKFSAHTASLQFENDALLTTLSEAKQALESINKKLEHAATHDPLTDLANHSLFEKMFSDAMQRAKLEQKLLALLFLDIDNFKEINDAYGHHIGDLLLKKIVERIKRKLKNHIRAARYGGDEITIIYENINNPEEIAEFAQDICNELSLPFEINDFNILITTSIGISIYPIDGRDKEMLLKNADKAMYQAKEQGGNSFHFNTGLSVIKS